MACWWRSAALAALAVVLPGCVDVRENAAEEPRARVAHGVDDARARHVGEGVRAPTVIVTIDGARWQEIFVGTDPKRSSSPQLSARALLPNIHRLAETRGALLGAPGRGLIAATGPAYVSLPGYTEILTGREPIHCQDNDCAQVSSPTLLDEAYAAGATVAAFASWDRLERAVTVARGRFVVSCGRDGDPMIDPYPGYGDFRPDAVTAHLALRHLLTQQPDVLFLGLGEPDEYAHRGDYEGYLAALAQDDAIVGKLFTILGRMGERGASTNVFVTSDHGRANDFRGHGGWAPESARVWLLAAGPAITARGAVTSSEERRLADVAPTLRILLGLPSDRAPHAGRPLTELLESRSAPTEASLSRRGASPGQ